MKLTILKSIPGGQIVEMGSYASLVSLIRKVFRRNMNSYHFVVGKKRRLLQGTHGCTTRLDCSRSELHGKIDGSATQLLDNHYLDTYFSII